MSDQLEAGAEPGTAEPARTTMARRCAVTEVGCAPLADLDPQALGVSYWLEVADSGQPYPVTIRLVGRRVGLKHKPGPHDRFDVLTTVDRVLPGSGPLAVTTRIEAVAPGQWQVNAAPASGRGPKGSAAARATRAVRPGTPRVSLAGDTGWAPIVNVRAPGVRVGAWPALVTSGAAAALAAQALLATHTGLPVLRLLLVSLLACLAGVLGAKVYYLALHPEQRHAPLRAGMCIQGFVLAAILVLALASLVVGVPVGRALDVTAPSLLAGMAIGRVGCFLGGCCAGRATSSRWGLWSSDRHLGMRRIPAQLLEGSLALAIGAGGFVAEWLASPRPGGTVFVGMVAAYVVVRQMLFPLRDIPRQTRNGRPLALLLATLVLVADIVVATVIA